jgi:hypothetical protein
VKGSRVNCYGEARRFGDGEVVVVEVRRPKRYESQSKLKLLT